MGEVESNKKRGRGIYLLPNLFTTAGLFAGFYAIIAGMAGRYEAAAIAIFIAMIMDGLDGRVARMTGTESDFGKEYDSLADMVSFGLAPALVVYSWALVSLGKIGWLAAFIYAAAAALRLARFNTQVEHIDKRYFQGLPSPMGAAVISGMVWFGFDYGFEVNKQLAVVAVVITIITGLLMVSNVRYHSFKGLDLRDKVPFLAMLAMVLTFVFISSDPPAVLFSCAVIFTLSGPVLTLIQLKKRRDERKNEK